MSEGITINIESVEARGSETEIHMSGTKPSIMPDIVAKNRLRLRAIRTIGLEEFGREAGGSIVEGDFGRITDIVDYREEPDGFFSEFDAVVMVRKRFG